MEAILAGFIRLCIEGVKCLSALLQQQIELALYRIDRFAVFSCLFFKTLLQLREIRLADFDVRLVLSHQHLVLLLILCIPLFQFLREILPAVILLFHQAFEQARALFEAIVELFDLCVDRLKALHFPSHLTDTALDRGGRRTEAADGVAVGVQHLLELQQVITAILQVGELLIEPGGQCLGGFHTLGDPFLSDLGGIPKVLDDPLDLRREVAHPLLDQIEASVASIFHPEQIDDDQRDQEEYHRQQEFKSHGPPPMSYSIRAASSVQESMTRSTPG